MDGRDEEEEESGCSIAHEFNIINYACDCVALSEYLENQKEQIDGVEEERAKEGAIQR